MIAILVISIERIHLSSVLSIGFSSAEIKFSQFNRQLI